MTTLVGTQSRILSTSGEIAKRFRVDVHVNGDTSTLRDDIKRGLTTSLKSLPYKYFYDARGSAPLDRITHLPEYYLTRVEEGIIEALAGGLMAELRPRDIVELGPGPPAKIRALLGASTTSGNVERYVPFDVDASVVEDAGRPLLDTYPFLRVHGVVGDLARHLDRIPSPIGRRLVVFFGSPIGNLDPTGRQDLLRRVRR